MKLALIFSFVFFWAEQISSPVVPQIVVWNVGQGSWTSWVDDDTCVHIDAGGSRPYFYPKLCSKKKNIFYFTHYDWDHINLSHLTLRRFHSVCRMQVIPNSVPSQKRKKLENIPLCAIQKTKQVRQIYISKFQKENESHAFLLANKFLITGDSSSRIERQFLSSAHIRRTTFLLAGHHGSRTSLSKELLKKTKNARMIFASCLQKKYGHPHLETYRKAAHFKLPLITTEKFGSVAIEVP